MNLLYRVVDKIQPGVGVCTQNFLSTDGALYAGFKAKSGVNGFVDLYEIEPHRYVCQFAAGSFKDKDGNQLWEGDEIRCMVESLHRIVDGVIRWNDSSAAFMFDYVIGEYESSEYLSRLFDIERLGNVLLNELDSSNRSQEQQMFDLENVVSSCCNAPVKVGGRGMTHYYVCDKCGKACDGKYN